jgi:CBS domain-containing protein
MLVKSIMARTDVVRPGTLVREVFAECGRARVQALPFVDETGRLVGRITLKNVMKVACLPEHMVAAAPLLGSFLSSVDEVRERIAKVLDSEADAFVQKLNVLIGSEETAIKALAIMAHNDTSYLFVVDGGEYQGIITIQGIAERMSQIDVEMH